MRSIVTFSPFQELHRFADMMDNMWDSNQSTGALGSAFAPPIDVWEQDGTIFIKAAVPGVDPNKIEVNLDGNVLTLSGEFRDEHHNESDNKKVYHREVRYGFFSRSIALPENVDQDKIDAEYKGGFMTVKIPRKTPVPSTKIKKLNVRNADVRSTPTPVSASATGGPTKT